MRRIEEKLHLIEPTGNIRVHTSKDDAPIKDRWLLKHDDNYEVEEVGLIDLFESYSEKIYANWVYEELTNPLGEEVENSNSGYETKYEDYLMIKIEGGMLRGTRKISLAKYEEEKKNPHSLSTIFSVSLRILIKFVIGLRSAMASWV